MATRGKGKADSEPQPEPTGGGAAAPADSTFAEQLPDHLPHEFFTGPGMQALADLLPVMIGFIDKDFTYRFLNRQMGVWFERPRREVLGRSVRDMLGEAAWKHREPLLRAALKGERQFFVSEMEHESRGPVAVQAEYIPWQGPGGRIEGIVVLVNDVTEQRTAERALRESEERFRRIANQAPVLMWVTRLDRVRDFVNDAYVDFLGVSREEARVLDWRERIHPDDVERILAESVAGEASLKMFTMEGRYLNGAGEYRWLKSVSSPRFGPGGEHAGFIGAATDITLAKEAELELRRQVEERTRALAESEEQLRQSQKMEALGQLTGGIAHDFNNLLTVVVGGLDVIAKRLEDPKLKRYAANALTAAERGARLTGQLLAFSRVQKLEVRPVEVAPLIENMRPLLRNVLGPGITKEFALQDIGTPVMADPTQLEVAVLNLAINARDAMPGGGVLKFVTRAVRVEGDPELEDGDYVELCISDTGSGMKEEVASRAFEPFFTTKATGKGTGLGLSMVYGMARQSGGIARIETALGEGTAVKLLFRAAQAAPIESSEKRGEEPVSGEARAASILVIDDDPDVRDFIAEALTDEGYRVHSCADGKSGLAAFGKEQPDLVVIDFVMPEMSGAEVAGEILKKAPDQKILFVSGYSETDSIRAIAPQSPLLAKPFRSAALSRAVRKALG